MSKFKVGDKVTPINMDRSDDLRLVSKAHSETVDPCLTQQSQAWSSVVKTLDEVMPSWTLHHETGKAAAVAAIKELARKAKKPKMLDRGDLIEYLGEVWIVTIGTTPTDIFAKISTMTGKERTRWVTAYDVTRVGNIRKKVKRIKKEVEDAK